MTFNNINKFDDTDFMTMEELEDLFGLWDDPWPELTTSEYAQLEQEYQEDMEDHPWNYMDCTNIRAGKLEDFIKGNNTYKRYDKKFAHPDVARKFAYYDPLHLFAQHQNYKNMGNKINRMLRKYAKNGVHENVFCYKIKSDPLFKKCWVYRDVALNYLEAIKHTEDFWYWTYMLPEFTIKNGVIKLKETK